MLIILYENFNSGRNSKGKSWHTGFLQSQGQAGYERYRRRCHTYASIFSYAFEGNI